MPGSVPRYDLLEQGATALDADPHLLQDLMQRVRELLAHARRPRGAAAVTPIAELPAGDLVLDLATQTVTRAGRRLRLTQTEFRLLTALARRRGGVATRDELLGEVWGGDASVSARVVDTHIARLRRKIEPDPKQPRHILTALASGYRFQP
ncbi:MAG TPA: response regulator transcription factor [Gemmatimonadales bacterium]|nr:response regulator transcription factor [Gemmatimonadales bacterium]